MPEIRTIVVVGLGSAGRRHARNLRRYGQMKVMGCSEWRRLTADDALGEGATLFHDYAAALATCPDAVVVANPTALHADYALRAIDCGCHVYVEKPLGVSAEEVRPVVNRARQRPVTVAVGNQFRFNPCLQRLKQLVDRGTLGRILHADVNMGEHLPDYHPDEDYRTSYAARRALGGGVLLTQIHDLNYLRWLFGPFESVYAAGGRMSRLEVDVEDSVSLLFRAASGAAVAVHMDYVQRPRRRTLTVIGEDATATWDYYANRLRLWARDGTDTELGPGAPFNREQMFVDTMADFLTCGVTGAEPRTGTAEGMADLQLVDAIKESLAHGAVVKLTADAVRA